ncbi:MAG: TVP38/TMEM64 family protein [Bacteroidales bacterium]|nr:TVP38/TMEM64 family protein [Fournierella massiliensis]MCF2556143.1 TVP38/TMEM64 family protein [Fournierella massiliensis]MCI6740120.1 TVP38/TMEM64 family protein [Bacteroidales bacterium]
MEKKKRILRIAFSCLLLAGVLTALTVLALPYVRRLSDPETQRFIQNWIGERGLWGIFILLGLQVLQVIIAFIPGEPMELLAGALCGALGGTVLCLTGTVLASACIFALSRRYGRRLLALLGFGEKQVAQWKWLQRDEQSEKADLVIFLVFLIPGTPKDMLTYVVGMTRVSLKRFLWLSTLARVPSVLSSTLIGSSVIQGEGETALILMLVTGLLGILGIEAREKILAFCRRVREKRKQD